MTRVARKTEVLLEALRNQKKKLMLRGDVYEASLNPVKGSEQGGSRPVLIVSRDAINKSSPVVVAIAFTGLENCPRIIQVRFL